MSEPLKPNEIARYAAEGAAIALRARASAIPGPFHLICGLPAELFRVDLQLKGGKVDIGEAQRFKADLPG